MRVPEDWSHTLRKCIVDVHRMMFKSGCRVEAVGVTALEREIITIDDCAEDRPARVEASLIHKFFCFISQSAREGMAGGSGTFGETPPEALQ